MPAKFTIKNDGEYHQLPAEFEGTDVTLPVKGEEKVFTFKKVPWGPDGLWMSVSQLGIVRTSWYPKEQSDPLPIEEASTRLGDVGIQVEIMPVELSPCTAGWRFILNAAKGKIDRDRYYVQGNIIYKYAGDYLKDHKAKDPVYSLEQIKEEAVRIQEKSLEWAKGFFSSSLFNCLDLAVNSWRRSLLREIVVDDHATIERRKVGVPFPGKWVKPYFGGSGGGWSNAFGIGKYTGIKTESGEDGLLFDTPGVYYTAAGDDINGGRLSFRVLYIVEPK